MSINPNASQTSRNLALILLNKKFWIAHFLIVVAISVAGLIYLGGATYTGAPPLVDFKSPAGETVISRSLIKSGEEVFHLRGLMSYGSFWGDGADRGPDFTADALHRTIVSMQSFYENEIGDNVVSQYDKDAIATRVQREVHTNTWDEESGLISINAAQVHAFQELNDHYTRMFTDPEYPELFQIGYITEPEDITALTAFFYWGGWVSAANRPGEDYSYTHNWPYDPQAGNTPTTATYIWSVISIFGLFLGIGLVLYVYGK
ncbi:MAG: hypothetical protein QF449_10055 [Alphaproteobacteria bacterium]|jgi:nitric oxide reductase subunit B|nr:hypothetical protein [Rhodospirillales bacterium]MDP6818366.1 hypothetical protein [Alphaproteobacteria bacterium]|tara:strand:- start:296 stop:1078 length:783 start_codon:yes stop_codon:yes gene_type:complete